jgi:hypothetical protein
LQQPTTAVNAPFHAIMPGTQFPYPRKTSAPPPFKAAQSIPLSQRRDVKRLAVYAVSGFSIFLFLIWLLGGSSSTTRIPPGTPEVVIVTALDKGMSDGHRQMIIENRKDYAQRHGYTTFFPNNTDYDLMPGVPKSWSMVPSMRHAMTTWPHTPWLWYLASTAIIMEPSESLRTKVFEPRKLESLMIVDKPVVPPDSVIKTFAHLRGERIDLILTQDKEGLASGSFMVRTGEWAKYFLDAWFDPLYRSYNFQKAESHALEHIVQWHGTVLAKLALVPQRLINSYMAESKTPSDFEGKLADKKLLVCIN